MDVPIQRGLGDTGLCSSSLTLEPLVRLTLGSTAASHPPANMMFMTSEDRISPRLQHALVADLVVGDLSPEADALLIRPLRDEWDWTSHLGRQLGMAPIRDDRCGIHETLLFIVRELAVEVNNWPVRHDEGTCRVLARAATKDLGAVEVYSTLLAGPSQWRKARLDTPSTVENLNRHLQPLLENALTTSLASMLKRWVEWDVPKLGKRRKAAIEAQQKAEAEEAAKANSQAASRGKPSPRDRKERLDGYFTPPGRT